MIINISGSCSFWMSLYHNDSRIFVFRLGTNKFEVVKSNVVLRPHIYNSSWYTIIAEFRLLLWNRLPPSFVPWTEVYQKEYQEGISALQKIKKYRQFFECILRNKYFIENIKFLETFLTVYVVFILSLCYWPRAHSLRFPLVDSLLLTSSR